ARFRFEAARVSNAELIQARREIVREGFQRALRNYQVGRSSLNILQEWSGRLLAAERTAGARAELGALEKLWKLALQAEAVEKAKWEAGIARSSTHHLEATRSRLDAQTAFMQAKAGREKPGGQMPGDPFPSFMDDPLDSRPLAQAMFDSLADAANPAELS